MKRYPRASSSSATPGEARGRDIQRPGQLGRALVPGVEDVVAGRHGGQEKRAVARGLREVGAIAHHEQRTHLRVHVAVDPDDACPLEPDGARLAPAVEAEIEGLLFGERENVVIEGIVVREGDRGADRHAPARAARRPSPRWISRPGPGRVGRRRPRARRPPSRRRPRAGSPSRAASGGHGRRPHGAPPPRAARRRGSRRSGPLGGNDRPAVLWPACTQGYRRP